MELTVTGGNTIKVDKSIFARDFSEALVHQVVTAYLAGARAGTKAQKNRSAVSGGGRKPWAQKGTGRARAGTIRSPLWRGGGATFAASPRDHSQKVNRKMYRAGMQAILSELLRQDRLVVIEDFNLDAPKTAELVKFLAANDFVKGLLVTENVDDNLYLSARNIPAVYVLDAEGLDPVSLVRSEKVVMTVAAIKKIQERLS
ncbi:MAG: 50S ribosomal protein L4 [Xanthomonadales bacterium]|nr:50S ribosomal protein L4 [Xanthomonadales bacterium]